MSLFDDDFYNTKESRRGNEGKNQTSGSFRDFRDLRDGFRRGAIFQSSTIKVAVISSLATTLLVIMLFGLFNGDGNERAAGNPALAGGQPLLETSERIISASEKVRPAVVSIINLTNQAMQLQDEEEAADDQELPEYASMGSGVIFQIKKGNAYIITNAHVLQDAAKVQAVLFDGGRKEAKIIGMDIVTDLAILEISADGVEAVVDIGNSSKLRVGEMVIAIGNPLGFGDSLTQGIVSSTNRIIPVSLNQDGIYDWEQEVIQTDAAINQGNSGGALVDLNGKLVGINSMKVADYGVEGIGFAIPIDDAMPILNELLERGKILRPYIGIYTVDLDLYLDSPTLDPEDNEGEDAGESEKDAKEEEMQDSPLPIIPKGLKDGIIVLEAVGPALEAGLKYNDIIVQLDETVIESTMDLRKYLYNSKKIGESVKVTFYRDGKKKSIEMTLTEKIDEEQ